MNKRSLKKYRKTVVENYKPDAHEVARHAKEFEQKVILKDEYYDIDKGVVIESGEKSLIKKN